MYKMYKLKTSAEDNNELSNGFDQGRGKRQRELTINKNQNRK